MAKKVNKAAILEVVKTSSAINISNKYSWVINNIDIDVAKDLGVTGVKKY